MMKGKNEKDVNVRYGYGHIPYPWDSYTLLLVIEKV